MKSMTDRRRRTLFAGVAVAVVVSFVAVRSSHAIGWMLIDAKIRHDFPRVPRISTGGLATWLEDRTRPAPVLLDVRTRAEYDVSHLRGAQRVEPGADITAIVLPKDRAIVTYCSVGYRSGALAQRLRDAGYTDVENLDGSIFKWANEGRAVVRGNKRVAEVHPYNRTWGLLLQKRYRAENATYQ